MRCVDPDCNGLLEVVHSDFGWQGADEFEKWKQLLAHRRMWQPSGDVDRSGIWRFRERVMPMLPVEHMLTRAEGATRLYRFPKSAAYADVANIAFKHEGENPTGSFKDRGIPVAMSWAKYMGATGVACASTGNTAASVASYAALAGLPAVIMIPESATALGKVSQSLAYGARVVKIRGGFDDALRILQETSEELGLSVMNSLNPIRLEGQKTIIWEMLEQRKWVVPDWIVVPGGNLGNAAAFGKALREFKELGWIDRVPRLAVIQAEGAAPLAWSWRTFEKWRGSPKGTLDCRKDPTLAMRMATRMLPMQPFPNADTIATAIRIGAPVNYPKAMRALVETNGTCIWVPDRAIMDAKAVLDSDGVGAEPAACATLAGVKLLREWREIRREDDVVCILTGHMLKDPDATIGYHAGGDDTRGAFANPPVTIDATPDAFRRLLDR